MSNITLSLDKIQVLKNRKHWNLYLMMVINHPTDASKKLVRIIPDGHFINFKKETDDSYSFVPNGGSAGDGLEMISMNVPQSNTLDVQVYVKNHEGIKKFMSVLESIKGDLKGQTPKNLSGIAGKVAASSWLSVAGKALDAVGGVINDIPDRNMGMLSMGLDLIKSSAKSGVQTFSNKTTTGEVELTWSWVLDL